ncbi:hypothetical protein [Acetobacter oeni]|nr:hypothetical protein [Acetobacter oeni]MBB3884900.1 hypothetical protein [Acetobacter oeni]
MSPRIMANFGLSYDSDQFCDNFSLHYAGPQSVTLVNDERRLGDVSDTLTIGYRFKPFLYAKIPTFRMNFTNLTGSIVRTGPTGVTTNTQTMPCSTALPSPVPVALPTSSNRAFR